MTTRQVALLFGLVLLAVSCGPAVSTTSVEGTDEAARPLGGDLRRAPVVLLSSGHFGKYVYHGISRESFWVDLAVRNDSATKEVGIVWSSDDWATSHTAPGVYEGALPDGREQWGIDVADFFSGYRAPEVRFAAFAKMNGQTHWSALRNHVIYQPVTVASPVRLLRSSVSLSGSDVPVLEGLVRALNVEGRRVFIRYSIDEWATSRDFEAALQGEEFAFSIPLPSSGDRDRVVFAVALEAEGRRFWDNNRDANFGHQLAPTLREARFQDDGSVPSSGLREYRASISCALPLSAAWVRLDGGPRIALAKVTEFPLGNVGFSAEGTVLHLFAVAGLAKGAHSIQLEAAAGPFVRSFPPQRFQVDDGLNDLSTWDLSGDDSVWDFKVGPQGETLVMTDHGVTKYATFGARTGQRFAAPPVTGTARRMAIDASGRVYTTHVWDQLVRWLPDGTIDQRFGAQGVLNLAAQTYDGTSLCSAADIEATPSGLYVVDSCNVRVLRLSEDGTFLSALDLRDSTGAYQVSTRTVWDGASLWVGRERHEAGRTQHQLLRIVETQGRPSVGQVINLDLAGSSLDAFQVTAAGVWVGDSNSLHWLDLHGTRQATWTGAGAYAQPGALDLVQRVRVLSDGTVAVLSTGTNRIERFALKTR